jgi:uncharacterized repeat protein (TIGR01451 family)
MNTCRKVWPTALALALAAFVAMLLAAASQPVRAAGPWYVAPAAATATEVVLPDKTANLSGRRNAGFTAQGVTSTNNLGPIADGELITSTAYVTVLDTQQSCVPYPDGIISWWPGDGNATDIADGNHGTLQGGTGFAAGNVGQAFSLDGSDDQVNVGNALNLHVSTNEFTVLAWVRFDVDDLPPIGHDMSVADKMSGIGLNGNGWRLVRQRDVGKFMFCLGGGGINGCDYHVPTPPTTVLGTTFAQKDVWYHVAGVLSWSEFSIYVNGVLEDSKPRPTFTDSNSTDLLIGNNAPEGAHLDGLVDEVALFNRALSAAEIQNIFNAGSTGMCKHLGFSTKTANPSTASPGDPLAYTIALKNGDATNITNVRVTDTLPISLTYISDSLTATGGSYGYNNRVITWTGSVNAGGALTITFGATVGQTPTMGSIVNSAVISGGGEIITRTVVAFEAQICNLTKYTANPVLSVGVGGSWDDDDVWSPALLKEGGGYKMWYTGDDGSNPPRIGLATSTNGITWTKSVSNPVLSPGPSWEARGIRAGGVITEGGLYKMWYTGFDSNGVGRIGYATSSDGAAWTKYGSNPMLDIGASGSWEDEDVLDPTVIKEGSTYHMWYWGYDGVTDRIGHATSSNGTAWTKDSANPVLDIGSPGGWDWLHVYGPSVMRYNNTFLMWYSGETLPEAWQTGYALSPDGSAWTRGKMLIPEGAAGAFDANSADYPSVIADGDQFKVWYSGLNASGVYNVGYATAEVCSAAAAPANSVYLPIVLQGGGAPSCPTYYADSFSDPGSGWGVYEDSDGKLGYTGGQYQIWLKKPSLGWTVTPGAKATDFAAAVSAHRASGSSGAYGIAFGINEDWSQQYEFDIGVNSYSIWKYDGSWTALRNWTSSSYIGTGTSWNRLKVIRSGANIAVYVNNHYLTTVSDSSLTGLRRIGLTTGSSSSASLDARFDDFALYPAECGVSAAGAGFEMGEPGIHEGPVSPGLD